MRVAVRLEVSLLVPVLTEGRGEDGQTVVTGSVSLHQGKKR